jgi:inner membrane protein
VDSLTQVLLGASVGTVVLYRKAGWRAVFWGGLCGLFPDLDIFIPFGDAVRNFTYHRGFSHSLFVLTALTPLFAALIMRIHPYFGSYRLRWHLLVFLAFITHILLDGLTVYGTQILWPLKTPPVMWSTLFIIDPLYSLPLAVGVFAALLLRRRDSGFKINTICLGLSTLYIFLSIGAKVHVNGVAHENIDYRSIAHRNILTVPTPFNTVLWRIVIVDDHSYYEGFYSLLDPSRKISMSRHPLNHDLLSGIEDHWPVRRLQWFTHGFYAVNNVDGDIVMADLRMGLKPNYVFQFKVAKMANPHALPLPNQRYDADIGWEKLPLIWHRVWNPDFDTGQTTHGSSAG